MYVRVRVLKLLFSHRSTLHAFVPSWKRNANKQTNRMQAMQLFRVEHCLWIMRAHLLIHTLIEWVSEQSMHMNRVESGNRKQQMQWNCPIVNDTYRLQSNTTLWCFASFDHTSNGVYLSFLLCTDLIPKCVHDYYFFFWSSCCFRLIAIDFMRKWSAELDAMSSARINWFSISILPWIRIPLHKNIQFDFVCQHYGINIIKKTYTHTSTHARTRARAHIQAYTIRECMLLHTKKYRLLITQWYDILCRLLISMCVCVNLIFHCTYSRM